MGVLSTSIGTFILATTDLDQSSPIWCPCHQIGSKSMGGLLYRMLAIGPAWGAEQFAQLIRATRSKGTRADEAGVVTLPIEVCPATDAPHRSTLMN